MGSVTVRYERKDYLQLRMDGLFGVREALQDGRIRPFRGIRDGYLEVTGDLDFDFGAGTMYRTREAISTADFPNILLNSMTKRLIQDYKELGLGGVEKLITPARRDSYKTADSVRLGFLGDLPTVAEAAVYTELTPPTDEKVSYSLAKHGGVLAISEETIRNDDLSKIAAFPSRLARSGIRTLRQFITDFFVNNPLYDPDAVA